MYLHRDFSLPARSKFAGEVYSTYLSANNYNFTLMSTTAEQNFAVGPIDPIAGFSVQRVTNTWQPRNSPTINDVAKLCHEFNKIWCQFLGDDSQLSWEEAPDWQRTSAIDGVNYHLTNIATTPRDSHMNWLRQKQQEGWSWGPTKDPANKIHPCFCSYENLPWYQQVKDHILYSTVKALEPILDHSPKELSNGQRIADVSFNPSRDWRIDFMKSLFSELYDFVERFEQDKDQEPGLDKFAITQIHRSAAIVKTDLQMARLMTIVMLTR